MQTNFNLVLNKIKKITNYGNVCNCSVLKLLSAHSFFQTETSTYTK
jgi:hypothetical protein